MKPCPPDECLFLTREVSAWIPSCLAIHLFLPHILPPLPACLPAGYQLLHALGLMSDVPDPHHAHAWLEMHQGERFGLVMTHVQELLEGPAEEQAGFLDMLERLLQVMRERARLQAWGWCVRAPEVHVVCESPRGACGV